MKKILSVLWLACCACLSAVAQDNVIDEIVWVVGDDAILRSDIETQRLYMLNEGQRFDGDPYCVIPEQLAIQKLYLNQAKIDSITANENQVIQSVDQWMNMAVNQMGSREKLEEYMGKKFSQIKEERKETVREQQIVQQMQQKLIGEIKLTPAEIRKYFNQLPQDSLPTIPTTVEVQIVTMEPKIPFEETDAIKARLRDFTEQVNTGKMEFSTLARLYSEDPGSSVRGGELGFMSKTQLLPEFANVAFSLNDPKKVSKIVRTEFGYHIIQLIDKRGDKINVRHILLKPKIDQSEVDKNLARLDSIADDIRSSKFTFDAAAQVLSDDKDTRNNKGLMANDATLSSRFQMKDLPQDIAKVVDTLQVGQVSSAFEYTNERGQKVCAIVKLKNRIDGHKANMTEDFQVLRDVVINKRREEKVEEWIEKKIASTYVRISPNWRGCDFRYKGWVK